MRIKILYLLHAIKEQWSVIFDNELVILSTVIAKRAEEKTREHATVMYHELKRDPNDVSKFTLDQTLKVMCRCKEQQDKTMSCNNFGALLPLKSLMSKLASSSLFKILWVVKWTSNGLQPTRPVLVTVVQLDISAQHALLL